MGDSGEVTMANISDALFWISLVGSFVLTVWGLLRNRKVARSLLLIAFLSAVGATYYDLFQSGSPIRPRGVSRIALIIGRLPNQSWITVSRSRPRRCRIDAG